VEEVEEEIDANGDSKEVSENRSWETFRTGDRISEMISSGRLSLISSELLSESWQRRMWYEARANVTGVTARVKFPRMGVAESNK
jgi:hypothetical protein